MEPVKDSALLSSVGCFIPRSTSWQAAVKPPGNKPNAGLPYLLISRHSMLICNNLQTTSEVVSFTDDLIHTMLENIIIKFKLKLNLNA